MSDEVKVLVADDGRDNREFIVDYILKPNGFIPLIARDGLEAMELVQQHLPDIILLDLQMPRMNGMEVLEALQDSGLAGKVKYVGFDSSERLVKALEEGQMHGLVLQDPINMGYLGVKTMVRHLSGEKVEERLDTGSTVATAENMNDPKVRGLLEPDYKKWLGEQ